MDAAEQRPVAKIDGRLGSEGKVTIGFDDHLRFVGSSVHSYFCITFKREARI